MDLQFDPAKDQANLAKHGVSLGRARELDFRTALLEPSKRSGLRPARYLAIQRLDDRVFTLVFA